SLILATVCPLSRPLSAMILSSAFSTADFFAPYLVVSSLYQSGYDDFTPRTESCPSSQFATVCPASPALICPLNSCAASATFWESAGGSSLRGFCASPCNTSRCPASCANCSSVGAAACGICVTSPATPPSLVGALGLAIRPPVSPSGAGTLVVPV